MYWLPHEAAETDGFWTRGSSTHTHKQNKKRKATLTRSIWDKVRRTALFGEPSPSSTIGPKRLVHLNHRAETAARPLQPKGRNGSSSATIRPKRFVLLNHRAETTRPPLPYGRNDSSSSTIRPKWLVLLYHTAEMTRPPLPYGRNDSFFSTIRPKRLVYRRLYCCCCWLPGFRVLVRSRDSVSLCLVFFRVTNGGTTRPAPVGPLRPQLIRPARSLMLPSHSRGKSQRGLAHTRSPQAANHFTVFKKSLWARTVAYFHRVLGSNPIGTYQMTQVPVSYLSGDRTQSECIKWLGRQCLYNFVQESNPFRMY